MNWLRNRLIAWPVGWLAGGWVLCNRRRCCACNRCLRTTGYGLSNPPNKTMEHVVCKADRLDHKCVLWVCMKLGSGAVERLTGKRHVYVGRSKRDHISISCQ
jgi:hypothetical protein